MDAGIFAADDWRLRPNLTLSLGLRYEVQTNIHDWRDIAPRVALAWAPAPEEPNRRPFCASASERFTIASRSATR